MRTFLEWLVNEVIQTPPLMMHVFLKDNLAKLGEMERQLRSIESIMEKAVKISSLYHRFGRSTDLEDVWQTIKYALPLRLKNRASYEEDYSKRIQDILNLQQNSNVDPRDIKKYLQGAMIKNRYKGQEGISDVKQSLLDMAKKNDVWETNFLDGVIQGVREDWDEEWNEEEGLDLNQHQALEVLRKSKKMLHLVNQYVKTIVRFERGLDLFFAKVERASQKHYSSEELERRGLSRHSDVPPQHRATEILFHATPFMKEIQQQGLKVGEQKSLGGEIEESISFTADVNVAREIVRVLREAIAIAKGQTRPEDIIRMGKSENVNVEDTDAYKWYMVDREREEKGLGRSKSNKEHAFELYKMILAFADRRYDPLFFGVNIEDFANFDPKNVGIIAARVDMSKVKTYLQAMEEYRAPPEAVLGMKVVPS